MLSHLAALREQAADGTIAHAQPAGSSIYSGVGTAFVETAFSPRGASAKAAVACRDWWERGALYSSFTRKEKYGRHNDSEE